MNMRILCCWPIPIASLVVCVTSLYPYTFEAQEATTEPGASDTQRYKFEYLDLVIDRTIWHDICGLLALSDEQLVAAERLFAQYSALVTSLDAKARTAVDAAGRAEIREIMRECRERGLPIPWDEIDMLMIRSKREGLQFYRKSDDLLGRFYSDLGSVLTDEQGTKMPRVEVRVRWLNIERRTNRATLGDFPGRLDVESMAAEARKEGNELAPLNTELSDEPLPAVFRDASRAVDEAILRFSQEYDVMARERYARVRRAPSDDYKSTITRDDAAYHDLVQRWNQAHSITDRACSEIARILLQALGEEAHQRWIARYYALQCPSVYQSRWPDEMVEWLSTVEGATDEQLDHAEVIYNEYLQERTASRERAVRLGLRSMRENASPGGTGRRQLEYEEAKLKLRELIEGVTSRLRSLLTPEQEKLLDDKLWDYQAHAPWKLGPPVDASARRILTDLNSP